MEFVEEQGQFVVLCIKVDEKFNLDVYCSFGFLVFYF